MICKYPKPRYSEQMESGVLYFVAREKCMVMMEDRWLAVDEIPAYIGIKTGKN